MIKYAQKENVLYESSPILYDDDEWRLIQLTLLEVMGKKEGM